VVRMKPTGMRWKIYRQTGVSSSYWVLTKILFYSNGNTGIVEATSKNWEDVVKRMQLLDKREREVQLFRYEA